MEELLTPLARYVLALIVAIVLFCIYQQESKEEAERVEKKTVYTKERR